jgi:hypothetical protein
MTAAMITNSEELHQVVELAVDISADSDWASDWLDIALLGKDLLGLEINALNYLLAEGLHLVLRDWLVIHQQLDLLVKLCYVFN